MGASKGPNSWGKGEVVAGREGEESRADLEESRYWMETGAEFVSLDVTPCSTTLRSEMLLGLLLPPPAPAGSHPLQIQPHFLTATAPEIKPG